MLRYVGVTILRTNNVIHTLLKPITVRCNLRVKVLCLYSKTDERTAF